MRDVPRERLPLDLDQEGWHKGVHRYLAGAPSVHGDYLLDERETAEMKYT